MPKSAFTPAYASFLKVLITARTHAGLTQTELAVRIGKDQRFVSLVERGVRRLDVIEFFVFARGLGLDPKLLFADVEQVIPADIEI